MNISKEHIFNFNDLYKPAHHPPKENGYYMTIRCGLGGIYTHLNEWKDNNWQIGITDDSTVIAYSREKITKEQVTEWYSHIIKNYNNKIKNMNL